MWEYLKKPDTILAIITAIIAICALYLKKQGIDLNVNLDALQAEYDGLRKSCAELGRKPKLDERI